MERAGSDLTAFGETVVFLDYFKDLPDPRQAGKVIYPLPEVLLLCLLAVLAGAETFVDIARFGEKKIALLRRFRPFCHGTPAHDHLGDILSVLDAEQFQRCFVDWVAALTGAPKEVIAIDGKTLRRSGGKKGAQAAVHMVSAFAAHQRLVLGQQRHQWPGLQGVVMVESTREIANRIERETRFYITSLAWLADQLGPVIRSHWAIENSLHWVMDMVFRDDECRVRTDQAPANFTTLKHMAHNLIRKAPGKDSLRLKRKTAGWDDDFLESLLTA